MKFSLPISCALILLGGIFIGFSKCGGYVWHWQLYACIVGLLTLINVFIFPKNKYFLIKLPVIVVGALFTAWLSMSLGNAIYQTNPLSFNKLISNLTHILQNGLC